MGNNKNLDKAKTAKNDEFYTQLTDIEKELGYYTKQFKDKVVLCNCDDPVKSNFVQYFATFFNVLELKKLIATCYSGSPLNKEKKPYKAEITKQPVVENGIVNIEKTLLQEGNCKVSLEGDGDFASQECRALLEEADIVVTNPPFSLFRKYVATLMEYEEKKKLKFLIIGNQNALTYKEIFPLIKNNKIRLGKTHPKEFIVHGGNSERKNIYINDKNEMIAKFGNICWFTNMKLDKQQEKLELTEKYEGNKEKYPKFDNYDAININKIEEIPFDYEGMMGVPITYLDKHNPEQFEILGITDRNNPYGLTTKIYTPEDGKNYGDLNRRAAIRMPDNSLKCTYARLLIRNLHPEPRPSTQPATDSTSADLSDSMPASAPIISCAEDCSFQLRTMDRFNAMVAVTEGATVQQPQLPLAYADGEPTAEPQTEPTAETERPEDAPCLQPA